MTPELAFTVIQRAVRVAIEDLDPEEQYEVLSSLTEWSCDLINDEVDFYSSVGFPYEQGDGEAG